MRAVLTALMIFLFPLMAQADERLVRLYAPAALIETGLFKHAMPRFSLKTQVRVEIVNTPEAADFVLGGTGAPVFDGLGQSWSAQTQDTQAARKLLDWMTSDVGQRTIFGYAPDGSTIFSAPVIRKVAAVRAEMGPEAILGKSVSRTKCARCHAVDADTRKTTIGSTPSFFVLKTFEDWEYRFSAFYALKPHAAFTQVADVTEPFPPDRPSPIAPVEMTLDEVEAIVAYIAALEAADLGAPLEQK